jgi:hypothetical protein
MIPENDVLGSESLFLPGNKKTLVNSVLCHRIYKPSFFKFRILISSETGME